MVAICHSMNGAFGDEDSFSALRLCLIKRMKHGVGHEGILIAMDKEHRFGALANLLYLLRLGKRPAVAILAKSRSGIHQREGRQAKLLFELSGELIPYAGIAAVLHKALHVIGSLLSRYCHRGCRTHRNAVNHLKGILHSSL